MRVSEDVGSRRGVDCEISHKLEGEQNKGVKTSPKQTRFKNLEGKSERKSLKRTICVSGKLGYYIT